MKINNKEMLKIHNIQYEMLKDLIRVMDILNLKYFFVHGSLLGALQRNDFIDEDDDIDIALFREDYNKLIMHGQALIKEEYFIQNSITDDYPLPFAKLRKNGTAFIQPVLKNINCNQGIYIDIFPIDYYNENFFKEIYYKILHIRISDKLYSCKRRSILKKSLIFFSKIFVPTYRQALIKRELWFSKLKPNKYISIYGGKASERKMPIEWFEKPQEIKFRNIKIAAPCNYDKYLKKIYGNEYLSYNPAIQRMSDGNVEVSAEIIDLDKSYLDYMTKENKQ